MTQWVALALTLAVEIPVALLYVRWRRDEVVAHRVVAVAAAATLLSHPVVWFLVADLLQTHNFWLRVAVAEPFAVLFELVIYARFLPCSWGRAAGISMTANCLSFGLGLLLRDEILAISRAIYQLSAG